MFSIEPPTKHLVLHHTFDSEDSGGSVMDESPQGFLGNATNDVDFGYNGVIGTAARLKNDEQNINFSSLSGLMPLSELHATAWGRSERPIRATKQNLYAEIAIDGTTHKLKYSAGQEETEWQYGSLSYDGETILLRYAKRSADEPRIVDSKDVSGTDVESFELTFYTNGFGFVDDMRVYRRSLSETQDENLFEIGTEHQSIDDIQHQWDNDGLPYIKGIGNARLASTLGEEKDYVNRQLDRIRQSHHINDASGKQLDAIGNVANITRRTDESDSVYRARIIATMAAGRSAGTFEDLLKTTATVLDTTEDRIFIEEAWQSDPTGGIATARIYVRTADLNDAALSTADITSLLKDSVPAGHDVKVLERGANPFTLTDDQSANDPSKGLTSDSIATGGSLVSDV